MRHQSVVRGLLAGLVCTTGLLLAPHRQAWSAGWQWIECARVQQLLAEGGGPWLIDIRSPRLFEAEHIEGSVNINSTELANKSLPSGGTLIVIDDSLGQRSAREAAELLASKGHERVHVLKGGLDAWEADGRSLVVREKLVRGVTSVELQSALAEGVPVAVYDMRVGAKAGSSLPVPSEVVDGVALQEKLQSLGSRLAAHAKRGLPNQMRERETVVLVFAASEDASAHTRTLRRHADLDLRYLVGGSEIFAARDFKNLTINGKCPTCP